MWLHRLWRIINNLLHKDYLLVLQLNIRGILGNQTDLLKLLNGCTKNHKVDVVILCETWVSSDTKNLVNILGCKFISLERINKRGGGVGFLIANEIHYKNRPDMSLMSDNLECCFLELTMKGRDILCDSMYRPPNTNIDDANYNYSMFIDTLTDKLDDHLPIREKTISTRQNACEPWLTGGLIKCGKKQLQLYKKNSERNTWQKSDNLTETHIVENSTVFHILVLKLG